MGEVERIKPKDMQKLCCSGVLQGAEQRAINDLLADSQVQAGVDGTVSQLLRAKTGGIQLSHRQKGPIAYVNVGEGTAKMYPGALDPAEQEKYGAILRKYGLIQ